MAVAPAFSFGQAVLVALGDQPLVDGVFLRSLKEPGHAGGALESTDFVFLGTWEKLCDKKGTLVCVPRSALSVPPVAEEAATAPAAVDETLPKSEAFVALCDFKSAPATTSPPSVTGVKRNNRCTVETLIDRFQATIRRQEETIRTLQADLKKTKQKLAHCIEFSGCVMQDNDELHEEIDQLQNQLNENEEAASKKQKL